MGHIFDSFFLTNDGFQLELNKNLYNLEKIETILYSILAKNRENTENYPANVLNNRLKMEKFREGN